jgi:hypothetical protein
MHYPNCAYSIHEFTCNSATPDLQTIVPRACHLDVVGGNTITELDREGIRNAYVPGLQALLATGNRPQCGQYEFSPEQTQQACGSSCSSASGVGYKKVDTLFKSWCVSRLFNIQRIGVHQ